MPSVIRAYLRELRDSKFLLGRGVFSYSLFFWSLIKFFKNPRFRSEQISRIRYSKEIIQVSTFTLPNRYPTLFRKVAEELREIKNPKILSFGCSTGEEVLSLKQFIPNADITGIDINWWCLATAGKDNPYKDCRFVHVSDDSWKINEQYDCIAALAVFQKTKNRDPERKKADDSFGFNIFEKEVTILSKFLKINGLFILDHSDYQFTDLVLFEKQYLPGSDEPIKRSRPAFDKSNSRLSKTSTSNRIFLKIR